MITITSLLAHTLEEIRATRPGKPLISKMVNILLACQFALVVGWIALLSQLTKVVRSRPEVAEVTFIKLD